jgi:endonuclease/exonuclease/phosphatase family metal-dependent hydrolase
VLRGRYSWRAALGLLLLGWAVAGPRVSGRSRSSPAGRAAPRPSVSRTETSPRPPRASSSSQPKPREAATETEADRATADPFASAASCRALVGAGVRLPRSVGTARFVSWNLHWFPDGVPGQKEVGGDVQWLACALSWLDADVVAVQEVKQSASADQALATLLSELNRWSGAHYVARLDDCGRRVSQHVGLIWNEARVQATDLLTIAALNPHGGACDNQLRPGLAARMRFPGGLDLATVSAHFKSMADRHGFGLRGASFDAVPGVLRSLTGAAHDSDFLLLGDLNTMGCDECAPAVSSHEEVTAVAKRLLAGGVRVVPADAGGSELYRGQLTLLDHALAATAMRELAPGTRSHVAGACAAGAEALSARAAKKVRRSLSDHCPLVLDLSDRDLD